MYLYFTCKYIFQLSHHLKLIKEFLHLVISHLQVVRTVIGIKITIKNFMLWFHYLCQMSYINHELRYSRACVNMHHNRDHEAFTEICNSRLNFPKHLRIQARTQLCERMTGAVVLSERQVCHSHVHIDALQTTCFQGEGLLWMHKISIQTCKVLVLAEAVTLLCCTGPYCISLKEEVFSTESPFLFKDKK